MNDWKIGTRITAGFGVIVAITFALGVYAYTRTVNIKSSEAQLAEDYLPSVAALSNINNNQYKQVDLLVRHAASSSDAEMDSLEAQMNELKEENNRSYAAYEATRSNAEETALYEKVKVEKAKFRDDMEAIRKLSRINTPATNKQALDKIDNELRPELTVYAAAMHNLIAYDMKGCQDGLGLIDGAVGAARIGVLAGLAVSVALAIPIVLFVVRSITRPVGEAVEAIEKLAGCDLTVVLDNDSGDEIGQMARSLNSAIEKLRTTLEQVTASAQSASSSSQELSSAAETLASGAQEQASSLEETSASLEQITATVRQSADNARQASQIASSSRESAERGQDVVTSAVHAMEEINVASAKISDIISTIDEIAFQTNLLAVNAAVEAARAGEEGRGFAVVASEVRSLAQRSAGAAKEIKALIQDSLRKVEKGSELVNRSGETLLSIVGSVKKVTDIVGEIAAAAEEQSTGVDQVNTAVTQIDQVTQQNSAQTEELSSTAQTLSDQSARLLKLVSIFKLDSGGGDFVARLEPAPVRKAVPVRPRATRPGTTLARKPARAHRPSGGAEVPAALLSAQSHASASADSFEEF